MKIPFNNSMLHGQQIKTNKIIMILIDDT